MNATRLARGFPAPLRRQILHFELSIEDAVRRFAAALDADALVLDAGAGEGQYSRWFYRQRYIGVDLGVGDAKWNYSALHAVADLSALPFPDACFDAAVNIVTLEHLRDPGTALQELFRILRPGGRLLLVAPHEWEVHQSPNDFFRFTRHGLRHLLESAGFEQLEIAPAGGYFRLLSRRLLNGVQFFTGGWRWLMFPAAAMLLGAPALLAPILDPLDTERNFTLGYICTATRLS